MATEILELKVVSESVAQAHKRLDELGKKAKGAESATDGVAAGFARLAGTAAGVISVSAAFSKLISTTREFDRLNAGLITATGSADEARVAFGAIQDFATKTPYDLKQATGAFISLVNRGLEPSERALTAYGDTASAMSGDLSDMVLAVANATKGEYDNLKKFGIGAQKEGANVSFTFKGVTETVKNTTSEIEQYFIRLGENNFEGAMALRMNTLDGAISNLGDAWDKMFLAISQANVGDEIRSAVEFASAAIEEFTAIVASGELPGYIGAIAIKFSGFRDSVVSAIDDVKTFWAREIGNMGETGSAVVAIIVDAFRNMPENIKAFIEILVIEIAATFDTIVSYGAYFVDAIKAIFTDKTMEEAAATFQANLSRIEYAERSSIEETLRNRDATIKASEDKIAASKKLREEYDKQKKAQDEADRGKDRLKKYGVGGKQGSPEDKAAAKKLESDRRSLEASLMTEEEKIYDSYEKRAKLIAGYRNAEKREDLKARNERELTADLAKLRESKQKELEEIRKALQTEEEAIQESYTRRMLIIAENVSDPESVASMAEGLTRQRDKELKALEDSRRNEYDSLLASLATEEEALRISQERKREAILENEKLTAEQKRELISRLEEQNAAEALALDAKTNTARLQATELLFSNMATAIKGFGGEQSRAYRTMIGLSRAAGIVQSTIAIATGTAEALRLGWPAGIAAGIQVAAQGAGILAQINGASYSGAYDTGGRIPAGGAGIVGEYGPEIVQGPATVTSRRDTRALIERAAGNGGGAAPQVNARIINLWDPRSIKGYLGSDDAEAVYVNHIQRNAVTIRAVANGGR